MPERRPAPGLAAAALAAVLAGALAPSGSADGYVEGTVEEVEAYLPLPEEPTLGGPCPVGATAGVDIESFFFDPSSVSISAGDQVTWTNQAAIAHTTTEEYAGQATLAKDVAILLDPPLWHSGDLGTGDTFTVHFCDPGTFTYRCNIHTFMTGTVTVT